jgi:hypothetical protein
MAYATVKLTDPTELLVQVPVAIPGRAHPVAAELVAEALGKALRALDVEGVVASADAIAESAVQLVQPNPEFIQERIRRRQTMKAVVAGSDWLGAEDIHRLQAKPPGNKSLPAADWKRRGRIFSVNVDGKDMFAGYQFDDNGQPLPVISEILKAYGPVADTWKLAAWFHFPNPWLVARHRSGGRNVAPKEWLDKGAEVVHAAERRLDAYVA